MENIKNMREENDMKQKNIADIIGIERSTYTSYEIGRDTIPLKHLNTLCNYFDISVDYALDLTNVKKHKNQVAKINSEILSKRLKELRQNNNLTQEKMAMLLHTSRSTWTGYESKKYLISTINLLELSRRFNCSIDYLLGKTDKPEKIEHLK